MQDLFKYVKNNLTLLIVSSFFLIALLNPVFKKYDYGAGFPLVVGFCLLLGVLMLLEHKKKKDVNRAEMVFLWIFAAFVALSFAFSSARNVGFSEVLAYLSVIPLYYLLAYSKNEWKSAFFRVVAVGLVISAVIGAFFYYYEPEMRLFGPFFNIWSEANVWPNAYALFVLMAWPVFLLVSGKDWRWWHSLGLALVAATFVLTFSRGAIIALGGQLVLLLLFSLKRINKKVFLHTFLIVLMGIVLFYGINGLRATRHVTIDIKERATFQEGTTSTDERLDFWKASVDLIEEQPVFGWGPFSFRYAYNPMQKTFLGNSDHNHNWFLKIAVENGLIAVTALILFFLTVLVTFVRKYRKLPSDKRQMAYLMGIALAGAFAHSIIDYNFNFFINLFLFFVILALFRSLFVGDRVSKDAKKSEFMPFFVILLVLLSIYEGFIFSTLQFNVEKFANYALYPRNFIVDKAQEAFEQKDYDKAWELAEKAVRMNKIDAQGYYVRALIRCEQAQKHYDAGQCLIDIDKVIELNPMNNMHYYRDYVDIHYRLYSHDPKINQKVRKVIEIFDIYVEYVKNNVHFTAYTDNVEAAAELVDLIIPHVGEEKVKELIEKKEEMLEAAEFYRSRKTY